MKNEGNGVLRIKVEQRNACIFSRRYHRMLISTVLKAIPPDSRMILDIGCGYGNITKILEKTGYTIVGLDIRDMFYRPYISEKLNFLRSDALQLPFPNNTFDCVISLDVIEHIKDDGSFVREVHRILKSERLAIIETPNRQRLSTQLLSIFNKNLQTFPKYYGHDALLGSITHFREYTKSELKELFSLLKFKEIQISGLWFGLVTPELGIEKPPRVLENLAHSWIIKAVK